MKINITEQTKEVKYENPFELYKKLSNNGNYLSLLMESKSPNQKYERKSIIADCVAIKIIGKGEEFRIIGLNKTGEEILLQFKQTDFNYSENYKQTNTEITGIVRKQENDELSEEDNTKLQNISTVIKTILAKFNSTNPYVGLYGVFAYDFAKNFYKVEERLKDEEHKDFELFIPARIHVLYDDEKRAEIIELGFCGKNFTACTQKNEFEFTKQKSSSKTDLSDEEYKTRVEKVVADIKNGRAMQCVLSRNTTIALEKHPFESYTNLRETNPAPYSFYYNLGENEILYGASPEMHIRIDDTSGGKEIQIRPIAGTIMRSTNPLEDAEARRKLMTDEKELREHTMLVDLARHELYKLCEIKSVEVTDLFTLEQYPNLYHLVSGVRGILKRDMTAIDALLITLPAGTLSGAPKKEAMKMIEQYEASRRGFYGGASGFISFNGTCNTGITIRSVHVRNNCSEVRGGAGIVALSTPEAELNEIKLKTAKMMSVLGEKK
ncbi:MAG: anthranilate synthase component I family protein [archaeon]|jgi:anthranilate synthase